MALTFYFDNFESWKESEGMRNKFSWKLKCLKKLKFCQLSLPTRLTDTTRGQLYKIKASQQDCKSQLIATEKKKHSSFFLQQEIKYAKDRTRIEGESPHIQGLINRASFNFLRQADLHNDSTDFGLLLACGRTANCGETDAFGEEADITKPRTEHFRVQQLQEHSSIYHTKASQPCVVPAEVIPSGILSVLVVRVATDENTWFREKWVIRYNQT